MPFPIADSSIMDHSIEATERVDLGRDILCAGDGLDITDYDRLSLGQGAPGILCAVGITGMQDNLMPWLASSSPAIKPRPVVEPEMKMRDMIFLLSADHVTARARCLTVRVSDRTVRHLISTGYFPRRAV